MYTFLATKNILDIEASTGHYSGCKGRGDRGEFSWLQSDTSALVATKSYTGALSI